MKSIKKIFLSYSLLASLNATSQSPSLSINVLMDTTSTAFTNYEIEMKMCSPTKISKKGDWFSHDTSTINFASLRSEEVGCSDYLKNGEGIEVLSGNETFEKFNYYEYSNQVFAWEMILVFRVSNRSSAAYWPYMYIILPIRYKSFVTHIKLSGITFQPGKAILLEKPDAEYKKSGLQIQKDLKLLNGVEITELPGLQFLIN